MIVIAVAALLIVGIAIAVMPSTPRLHDTQSYRTGQSFGPDAVGWMRMSGSSAEVGCQIEYSVQMPNPAPSWWDGSVVMQGCLDYVRDH